MRSVWERLTRLTALKDNWGQFRCQTGMIRKGNITDMLETYQNISAKVKEKRSSRSHIPCACSEWVLERSTHSLWIWVSSHPASRWGHCSAMRLHNNPDISSPWASARIWVCARLYLCECAVSNHIRTSVNTNMRNEKQDFPNSFLYSLCFPFSHSDWISFWLPHHFKVGLLKWNMNSINKC